MLAWSCSNASPVFEPVPSCPSCIYQGNGCCNRHVVPILLLESHVQINCWYSTAVALLEVVNAYAEKNQRLSTKPKLRGLTSVYRHPTGDRSKQANCSNGTHDANSQQLDKTKDVLHVWRLDAHNVWFCRFVVCFSETAAAPINALSPGL